MSAGDDDPVHLVEDETGDRFLVFATERGIRLDIRYAGDTLWMTQAQIAQLFGRDVSTISRHISSVLEQGELDETSSLQKVQTTLGRPATVYSLDMVISVGYRVSSVQATLFRRWATGILVQFARTGFVVDAPRLKQAGNADRIVAEMPTRTSPSSCVARRACPNRPNDSRVRSPETRRYRPKKDRIAPTRWACDER